MCAGGPGKNCAKRTTEKCQVCIFNQRRNTRLTREQKRTASNETWLLQTGAQPALSSAKSIIATVNSEQTLWQRALPSRSPRLFGQSGYNAGEPSIWNKPTIYIHIYSFFYSVPWYFQSNASPFSHSVSSAQTTMNSPRTLPSWCMAPNTPSSFSGVINSPLVTLCIMNLINLDFSNSQLCSTQLVNHRLKPSH